MDKDEVMRLAGLARIEISDKEAENLTREFESILNYVGEVKNATNNQQLATDNKDKKDFTNRNVMREDINPHEGGLYTVELLNEAPEREGNYIEVKKIL